MAFGAGRSTAPMNRMHTDHDEGGELLGHALVPRAEPQCGARFLDSRRADSSAGSGAHAVLPIQPRRDHTLAAGVTRYAATTGVVLLMAGCAVPAASSSAAPTVSESAGGGQWTPEASEPVPPATSSKRPEVASGPMMSPTAPSVSTLAGSQLTEVIVDELIARSGPGIGGDSEIYPGTIPEGTRLWLYDGPVTVAGYEWYHVVPEHGTLLLAGGSGGPVSDAWVAAGSRAREAWLQAVEPVCPGTASLEAVADLSRAARFLCFGDESIRLEGWIDPVYGSGGCGGSEPGWLTCFLAQLLLVSVEPPQAALTDPTGAPGWDAGASRFAVMFAPGVTRPMNAAGRFVEAVGHFDDPAAWGCGMPGFDDPEAIVPSPSMVYACRGTFVVASITVHD